MPFRVQIGEDIATVEHFRWRSSNAALADALNATLPDGGPSGSDPAPDWNQARLVAEKTSGVILDPMPELEPLDPSVVY